MGLLSVQFPKTLARVLKEVVSSASHLRIGFGSRLGLTEDTVLATGVQMVHISASTIPSLRSKRGTKLFPGSCLVKGKGSAGP